MKGFSNYFSDPLSLLLSIMVALSLLSAWVDAKQDPGIDYYVAWVAADAVKNDTPHNIYAHEARYKLAYLYRNKADELQNAPRQKDMAQSHQTLATTATPFLYWVTAVLAVGDYETDLDNWHAISLFILTISVLGMCRAVGYSLATSLALLIPLLVAFIPHLLDLREGNVNSFQLGFIALIFGLQSRGSDTRYLFAAGLVTGLMVMFKPNLAPVAVLLIGGWGVRQQYSKLGIMLSGMATGAISAFLVSSWWMGSAMAWFDWFNVISKALEHFGKSERSSITLSGMTGFISPANQVELALFFCFLCLGFLWWGRRGQSSSITAALNSKREMLENNMLVAMGCIVMLLSSTLTWNHYYLLTIPMFIFVFRPWRETGRMTFPTVLMLRVLPAVALLSMLDPVIFVIEGDTGGVNLSVVNLCNASILYIIGLWQLGFKVNRPQVPKLIEAPASQ